MKKIAFAFIPFLLVGFVLRDDSCRQAPSPVEGVGTPVDGPYVIYASGKADKIWIKYVVEDSVSNKSIRTDSTTSAEKTNVVLSILTDEPGKTFNVNLKAALENEKTEFPDVKKMFIVSDIEGNFGAFRKLLQGNNVIDSNFNWSFGDGHLVLTGDFVDRGIQQNEVLWLIYSLEEKAKAAGGYVHYILGNHEIMNMNGDHRYLHRKYTDNAALLGMSFTFLYGGQTEIGRWLRTKNVIERVGDVLFCHAGISAVVNRMDINTNRLNRVVRPYYGDSTNEFRSTEAGTLYGDFGPFWYRGYYHGAIRATPFQIDSTLSIYNVKHIATGHTVIADTISVMYGGKVFNTDVHHLKGFTEALLLEDGIFYRVKLDGTRVAVQSN